MHKHDRTAGRLEDGERVVFDRVREALFANPFGPEREALDRAIAGTAGRVASGTPDIQRTIEVLRDLIRRLDERGIRRIGDVGAGDRARLESAYLFDTFHTFIPELDALIERQHAAGEASCAAPFAAGLLETLRRRGFDDADGVRLLGLFFQVRRAYFFIYRSLTGRSEAIRALRLRLWQNVFTGDMRLYTTRLWNRMEDFSTLLLGETGTGKGAAAAAIGRSGFIPFDPRRGLFVESFMRGFVATNLAQFPEALIESELFGHRKGAFTGAVEAHEGVFARCSPHGSIFLDEIGEAGVPVQIKLLRVLQERIFTPVGSHEARRFHGRVIAASNRPLDQARRRGAFRDDFYHRLSSDVIVIPPLRERLAQEPGELEVLLDGILERIIGTAAAAPEGTAALGAGPAGAAVREQVRAILARDVGRAYAWPGNVRELEQAVRRILLTGHYQPPADGATPTEPGSPYASQPDAATLLSHYCGWLHRRHGTLQAVARITGLDRRTVRKHLDRPVDDSPSD